MSGPVRPIRVAYADPPYLGMASRYHVEGTPEYNPDAMRWDDPAEHAALLARLDAEYPDGWAYSLQSTALQTILPLAPKGSRVLSWVKPFVAFKAAWPVYAWEPVIAHIGPMRGKPRRARALDFLSCCVGHGHTEPFFGAKPQAFSRWLFDVFALGEHPDDDFVDVFPGSGAVSRAWDEFRGRAVRSLSGEIQHSLFSPGGP